MNESVRDSVRVLQVTDPHLFADADGELRGTVTADTLAAVVDHIIDAQWPADVVMSTGDLIQDDSEGAYERFKKIMGRLDLPVYCIPGNHDVRALMRAALVGDPWHYCESVTANDWLMVGIDSCEEDDAGGRISRDELVRLRAELENSSAAHAIVFLHHPPLAMGSRWLDSVGLRNASEFLDIVSSYDVVKAAVFGHVHQAFDRMHGAVRIIGTPSTCAQFKPFEDDFAVDDTPPAYRRLRLDPDGTIETELIWLGADE